MKLLGKGVELVFFLGGILIILKKVFVFFSMHPLKFKKKPWKWLPSQKERIVFHSHHFFRGKLTCCEKLRERSKPKILGFQRQNPQSAHNLAPYWWFPLPHLLPRDESTFLDLQRGESLTLRDGELKPFRNHLAPLWRCWFCYLLFTGTLFLKSWEASEPREKPGCWPLFDGSLLGRKSHIRRLPVDMCSIFHDLKGFTASQVVSRISFHPKVWISILTTN